MSLIRWVAFSLPLISLSVLSGGCCGSTTTERYTYSSGNRSYDSESGGAHLLMISTKTRPPRGESETDILWSEPYSLAVFAMTPDQYDQPLQVLAAELNHQGKTIAIHSRASSPLISEWKQDPHSKRFEAEIKMPLKGLLTYVEGSTATIEAIVKLPWEAGEVTLKREFAAEHHISSGTLFDAWMGI